MTYQCPNCETVLSGDAPITPGEVEQAVREQHGTWEMFDHKLNYSKIDRLKVRGDYQTLSKVERREPTNFPADEYARQGYTYTAALIFEVAGTYFLKEVNVDSYGEWEWDGGLRRVKPVKKTITVFE